jgi:hypothetical protein
MYSSLSFDYDDNFKQNISYLMTYVFKPYICFFYQLLKVYRLASNIPSIKLQKAADSALLRYDVILDCNPIRPFEFILQYKNEIESSLACLKQYCNKFFNISVFKSVESILIESFNINDKLDLKEYVDLYTDTLMYSLIVEKTPSFDSISDGDLISRSKSYTLVLDLDETLVHNIQVCLL